MEFAILDKYKELVISVLTRFVLEGIRSSIVYIAL